MKVVCINNMELGRDSNGKSRLTRLPLTIGKTYDVSFEGEIKVSNVRFYMIEKDNNDKIHITGISDSNGKMTIKRGNSKIESATPN